MKTLQHIPKLQVLAMLVPVLSIGIQPVLSQCANNNTLLNVAATPSCPGSMNVNCVNGGQYVLVNVVAGNTYTFSTCGGANWDTQITLYNNAGGGSLGYNDDACGLQSSVTWVATFTGQLRVLVDRYNCLNHNACSTLNIQCTPPPQGDCIYTLTMNDSWGDGWGSSYVGVSINGGPYQNYTVNATTNSISFGVYIGQTVTLNYNNSGSFQGENSYTLSLQGGGSLFSSGSPPQAGVVYSATVDCEPPPAPPEDCIGATTICGNQSFSSNANGTGNIADLNSTTAGCLFSTEQQGTWYTFSPSSGGTVAFSIDPSNPSDDYDFALWGPYPDGSNTSTICPPSSAPLRCSYAAPSGSTGLNMTATDLSENAGGDKWVRYLNVTAGQVYVLYISNYSQSGQSFSLTWNLGSGASLDCTLLPVELITFTAEPIEDHVLLQWTTASEQNSGHFVIERSIDGEHFHTIGSIQAAGNSSQLIDYRFEDVSPLPGRNYYRLDQIDLDGASQNSHVAVADVRSPINTVHPNPTDDVVVLSFGSVVDGTVHYDVYDMYGRIMKNGSRLAGEGAMSVQVDMTDLAAGTYIVHVILPNGQREIMPPILRN